jgi:hypothetical protein
MIRGLAGPRFDLVKFCPMHVRKEVLQKGEHDGKNAEPDKATNFLLLMGAAFTGETGKKFNRI